VRLSGRLAGIAVAVTLLAAPGAASAAVVNNGDFETGNLSGWQVAISGPSAWVVYTGTSTPDGEFDVPAPPQGTHAAVTEQDNPSRQILYQDISIPPGGSVNQLSLFAYYIAEAPIVSPDTLDFPPPTASEQYRIDVMKPTAPLDSVAAGDILATVFRTVTGDPEEMAPTTKTADLSAFAGQTVRLRLAVVATLNELNAGVDAVSVKSNGFNLGAATLNKKKGTAQLPVTVPDAGTLTLSGKGVKGSSAAASKSVAVQGGTTNLVVKAKGKKAKKLKRKGKVKVNVTVTYAPSGLPTTSQSAKVKLKKKT
jgi:hypothetical protein